MFKNYEKNVPTEELRARADRLDSEAVLALGLRKDKASAALLRKLAGTRFRESEMRERLKLDESEFEQKKKVYGARWTEEHRDASFSAKAALTRMKEADYLNDFIVELSTTNDEWKKEIVEYLGYIGDSRAIKHLGPLLGVDTCTPPQARVRRPGAVGGLIMCKTLGSVAAEALGNIVQPPFMDIQKKEPNKQHFFYTEWKQWWQDHKGEYR
ncbi:MAG: hypothetical protein HYV14_01640 [Elusimicrobia bacterium]|nr:hypothetical protein [Elusimicrobiota bacterium]